MSRASVAAAKIYVAMSIPNGEFDMLFLTSREPYRAVIDRARELDFHDIHDDSLQFDDLVDCLEYLVCSQ